MFDFRAPLFLILLAAIPLLILVQRRARLSAAKWRKRLTFFLRGAALLCAILALAELHRTHKEQRLAVLFLIDASESIPRAQHEAAFQQINAAVAALKPTDKFGIISFAKKPSLLLHIRPKQAQPLSLSLDTLTEQTIGRDGTDVLTALKRAIALLPDNHHRRIVLFSDGIHNAGGISLKDYLPLLSASDVEILTMPLDTVNDAVRVVQLQLPTQSRKGQRFQVAAVIETDGSIPKLNATLYHNGGRIHEVEWTLESGRSVRPLLTQQVSEEGSHTYQLKLNVTDEIPENNQGYGVVKVQDKPRALYLEADVVSASPLKTVLEENGFIVDVMSPAQMPTELVELQRNDVLILSNVSADGFSTEQLQSIENYVRDLGHGLSVIGGEHAYGPGGYTDTTLERVLPVEMTPRERKDAVAVIFVLDTSGSMANYVGAHRRKIDLAIAGVNAGIDNLEAEDVAGVIGFNAGAAVQVVSHLTADHGVLRKAIGRLKPTGGTTLMKEAIESAAEMLKANDAKRKHIILLSDGRADDSESAVLDLAKQIADAHISITTIAIGDANKQLLTRLAETGGGRDVFVQNLQQLPTVLMEAVRETQHYIVQEPFQPTVIGKSDLPSATSPVAGIGTPPHLHGYVATAEKETAQVFIRSHKDEPLLAGWNVGLGKAMAWTSDVKPAWAKEWIPWHNFGKFWGQVVNWTLPTTDADSDFALGVSLRHGVAEVSIDTRMPSQATYTVRVAGPDRTSESVDIQQVTTTRYTGTFQIQDSGSYTITAQREADKRKRTEILSLSYPAEYAEFGINTALLKMLAAETSGIHKPTPTQIAAPAGASIEQQVSLVHALLVAAALLFVLEMILRRFSITNRYIAAFLDRVRGKSADKPIGTQVISTLVDTVPSEERVMEDKVSSQPTETSMTRLLAAKRRAR